jgi:hypothetical protein
VLVKRFYRGSIPKEREVEAFRWLRDHGHGDLIKNVVSSTFGKGEDDMASQALFLLEESGFSADQKQAVHPATLKAFVKEQVEKGENIPLDLLGVFIGTKAEIK